MSALFGGNQPATPAPPPPAPRLDDPAVLEAQREQQAAAAQAAGRGSTILTSGQGVSGQPTTKKTVLGG